MLRSGDYRQSTVEPDEPGAPPPDPDEKVILTTREEAFAALADLNDPSPQPDDDGVERQPDVDAEPEPILEAPPVVAVIVTHNAGDWLDETLESFAGQTYDNLSVLVIDAASDIDPTDLFAHLGGFDPGIDLLGEDLDLCWRAHLVGARVVVAPAGRVRHREALTERRPDIDVSRVAAAHRVRTVLGNYQLRHLVLIAPQAFVIMMVEAVVDATMGRRDEARAQLAAWGTNLRHLAALPAARRRVRRRREHSDRSIRHLQTHTWARLGALVQVNRRALADEDVAPRVVADEHRSLVPYGVAAVVLLLVLGTRDLFFGPLPTIGELARAPEGVGSVWTAWLSGWNPVGLGSTSRSSSTWRSRCPTTRSPRVVGVDWCSTPSRLGRSPPWRAPCRCHPSPSRPTATPRSNRVLGHGHSGSVCCSPCRGASSPRSCRSCSSPPWASWWARCWPAGSRGSVAWRSPPGRPPSSPGCCSCLGRSG